MDQFKYTLAYPTKASAPGSIEWKHPKTCPHHKNRKPMSAFKNKVQSPTKVNAVIIYTVHVKTWHKFVSSLRLLELHFLHCYSYPIHIFAENSPEGKISDVQLATLGTIAPSAESITIQRLCFDDCVPTIGFPQVDFTANDAKGWLKQLGFGWVGRFPSWCCVLLCALCICTHFSVDLLLFLFFFISLPQLGYANMCRFYSYTFALVPELLQYDYYMRLDSDSYLCEPVQGDIFLKFRNKKCQYGYSALTQDSPKVTEGLYSAVQRWITLNQPAVDSGLISPERLKYFALDWEYRGDVGNRHEVWVKSLSPRQKYSNRMFETNFEISSFAPWRTKQWRSLMRYIETDHENGFYKKRWGDAPIHAIGVPLLLKDSNVCYIPFDWFGQRHKWMDPKPTVRKTESWARSRPACKLPTHDQDRNIQVPIEHRYSYHEVKPLIATKTNGSELPVKLSKDTEINTISKVANSDASCCNPPAPNTIVPHLPDVATTSSTSTTSTASTTTSTTSATMIKLQHGKFNQLSFLSNSKRVLRLPDAVNDGSIDRYLFGDMEVCHGKRVLVYHGNLQRELHGAAAGNSMGETVYFFSILKALHNICVGKDGKMDGAFVYASSPQELLSLPEVRMLKLGGVSPQQSRRSNRRRLLDDHRNSTSNMTSTSTLSTTTPSSTILSSLTQENTSFPPKVSTANPPLRFNFDLIITDTESLKSLRETGLEQEANCKYRILDVWGTPPSQNHMKVHTKQFWVPFPFASQNMALDTSPNTVIGNRVEGPGSSMDLPHTPCANDNKNTKKREPVKKLRQIAVWGKEAKYFKPHVVEVLGQLSKELDIPMYVAGKDGVTCGLPNGVYNLGILSMEERTTLLAESLFFIGLGDPVLGASPFEAMAHGTIYLNPVYSRPLKLWQNKQFSYTSQHPYAGYVNAPLAYDISWQNPSADNYVVKVVQRLLKMMETTGGMESVPFVPISFRPEYIESMVLENLGRDYCSMSRGQRSRGVAKDPISEYPSPYKKKPWEMLKNAGCALGNENENGNEVSPSGMYNSSTTICNATKFTIMKNQDLRGYDLFSLPSKNVAKCCVKCHEISECYSFTFTKDTCWLKKMNQIMILNNIGLKVTKADVVSGVKK